MIFNFLDKLGGFFDRHFIVAYWAPVFLTGVLFVAVHALHTGMGPLIRVWERQSAGERAVLAAVLLLSVTLMAYMLQALTSSVVRLFEGYTWPTSLARWAEDGESRQCDLLDELAQTSGPRRRTATFQRYFEFPPDPAHIRPTRLGNVLASAERYPQQVYKLSSELWWPRLFLCLPPEFREQVSTALMPMLSLLNLCCGCVLVSIAGGTYLALYDQRWWLASVAFLSGMALARLCYLAAVSQAVAYGNLIRSAFDLHRHEVLQKMRIFVPATYEDEQKLWEVLNAWLYRWIPPNWRAGEVGAPAWLTRPFRYDGTPPVPSPMEAPLASPPASPNPPAEYHIRVGWFGRDLGEGI